MAFAAVVAVPAVAQAKTSVTLKSVGAKKKPTSLVTFSGTAGRKASAKITVERQNGKRWSVIAKGRSGPKGRFALTWITPSKASRVTVRARLGSAKSSTRKFRITAPLKGAKTVKVSKLTRIISPSVVESVPTPGQPGSLTYSGGNDAQAGQILVIGQGSSTPDGFLGKVTGVDRKNGETVVTTVPATILDAVPTGSMDLFAQSVKATRSQLRVPAKVTCEGSVGASITHDVSFTSNLELKGAWDTFNGGLQSASLTAGASVDASVKAAIAASGSCSLAKQTLLSVKGPSISGFVGPVPVVMTSNLSVYLDATASASAEFSTGASAGFSASAGIGWQKGQGFKGIQTFSPRFSFDPPSLSAAAAAAVNVTPTVDVLLYGVVGPKVALRTGVEFNADTTQNPWWTLQVPVDLTASLTIAPLNLTSPELHLYQRNFPIADAGGPFGAPTPDPPAPVTNVVTSTASLAAGYAHSCALKSGGGVRCWGTNTSGQLGNGNRTASATPVAVTGVTDAVALAAGHDHTCALRVAGSVVCWGSNADGQLGDGTATDRLTPVAVTGISNAIAISSGTTFTCALLSTGRVSCWGNDDSGQLGDGGTAASGKPVAVSGLSGATAIGAGGYHACAVVAGGAVKCWGSNSSGQIGDGTTTARPFPVAVAGVSGATAVDGGEAHSCALLANGGVSCWGAGFQGQLGNGTRNSSNTAVSVNGISNAVGLGIGGQHSCAVLATGAVNCWGFNPYGEIGDGTQGGLANGGASSPADRLSPVAVVGLAGATGVTGGFEHTCAMVTSGALKCWGYGLDGELGNGAKNTSPTPVDVVGLP